MKETLIHFLGIVVTPWKVIGFIGAFLFAARWLVQALASGGYVTVVDFWSESCHACVALGGRLAVGVAQEPRVVIRKIDVGDGFTPVA